jgi:hypothetical protein
MEKKTIIILSVAVLVIAAIGFGAWQFFKSQNKVGRVPMMGSGAPNFGNNQAANGGVGQKTRGANSNYGTAAGKIIEKDDTSITVQTKNGGSMMVFYSGSTKISKIVAAAVSDLAVGQTITARGTQNDDGTINVTSAQIRSATELPAAGANASGTLPKGAAGGAPTGKAIGGFAVGQITAVSGNNVTLKSPNGVEQIIILSADAKISKLSAATVDELVQGTEVMATGIKKGNGGIIAELIQIGDVSRAGAMPGAPGAAQAQPDQPKAD